MRLHKKRPLELSHLSPTVIHFRLQQLEVRVEVEQLQRSNLIAKFKKIIFPWKRTIRRFFEHL